MKETNTTNFNGLIDNLDRNSTIVYNLFFAKLITTK